MIDFEQARVNMVESQIRVNDVTDHDIIRAFATVPRERFVPAQQRALTYMDENIAISTEGRFLMEARSLSKLIQLAEVEQDHIVLDIGCGTGYSTAILASLSTSVVALESDEELAGQAADTLMELGVDNAVVVQGALEKGHAKEGPYDIIFIGGAVEEMSAALGDQLKDGGRLVVVEGTGNAGRARLYTKRGETFAGRDAFNSAVKPLPGFEKKPEFVF
ncbi:MAG: protein-L-isoaspartate O-methyltransferase [Pseudomonadota bacterium]